MRITAEPRSDQWNAEDFIASSRTFTIAGVHPGKAEQKYDIELVEGEGRVWRPPLSMLRLLMLAWATDEASAWVGRRVTLYRDPDVSFGRDKVGGIRVSHVSHIDEPFTAQLTVSRGKRQKFTVHPLQDAPAPDWDDLILQAAGDPDRLRQLWAWAQQNGADQLVLDRIQNAAQPQENEGK